MELDYMQKLRWWLKTVDGWPSAELGEQVPKWGLHRLLHHKLLFTLWFSCFLGQLEFLRRNLRHIPFFALGHCYVTTLSNVVTVQRVLLIMYKCYRNVTREFVQEIHLFHHTSSIYAPKTYKLVNKICRIYSFILRFQTITATILFNMPTYYLNWSTGMYTVNRPENGTWIYTFEYVMPFDRQSGFFTYILITIYDYMLTFWVAIMFWMYDLYMITVVCHIWGHLDILDQELRNFMRPSDEHNAWYTPEEAEGVAGKLKELVSYHSQIMNFTNRFSNAFGLTLAVYFGFYQGVCCLLLLLCSTMETAALVEYGPLTLVTFQQLIQLSLIFEILGTKSKNLSDAVYSLPWECMGVRERRVVLSFLHKVQEKPINIKALGMMPIGVKPMAGEMARVWKTQRTVIF